jgi:hypothetical protein
MYTVLLPPGDNPVAVNKHVISIMVTRSLLTCIDLSLQFTAISEIPNHGKRIVCISCTINTNIGMGCNVPGVFV